MSRSALFRHLRNDHHNVQKHTLTRPQAKSGQTAKRDQKREEQENQEPAHKRNQKRNAPIRFEPYQTVRSISLEGENVSAQGINFLHRQHAVFRGEMQLRGIPPSKLPLLHVRHQKPDELEAVLQYKGNSLYLYIINN